MQYFFVLGNNPELSAAEIMQTAQANFKNPVYLSGKGLLLVESDSEIDADMLIRCLGGTIKIGLVKSETTKETAPKQFSEILLLKLGKNRISFGISSYSERVRIKQIGMTVKTFLKEQNISARWVVSREPQLSSVVVEQNDLLKKGAEFIIWELNKKLFFGLTLAVQPFKELSVRDYGRPDRDEESGMIPPKLAQIMLNLANYSAEKVLYDPFCGSGTILQEAYLQGGYQLFGSDISQKAVLDSQKNIDWLINKFQLEKHSIQIKIGDATRAREVFANIKFDCIITEPYLGPQRGNYEVEQVVKELELMYAKCLIELSSILNIGGKIVIILPIFNQKGQHYSLSDKIVPKSLSWVNYQHKNSIRDNIKRPTLRYGRVGQRVWRELAVFAKTSD
ncbi:MAG: hypothetical protein WCK11_02955 [Candidatus Falkowbacteria bacterium]